MAHTREEAQGTDGLEHDGADLAAARAGGGEYETDDEEKRGGVEQGTAPGQEPRDIRHLSIGDEHSLPSPRVLLPSTD